MGLSLERMRYWVRKGLGNLDEQDISDDDVDELLNMSLWDLESNYRFEARKKRYSFTLADGQYSYNLSGLQRLDAFRSVAYLDGDDNRKRLKRMTREWLDDEHNQKDSSHFGEPEFYLREENCLILYPTPGSTQDGNKIELATWTSVASLLEGQVEESGLPRNWDEMVVQGAIHRGHFYNEDYNFARQAVNFQVAQIRSTVPVESKEETNTHEGGLDVRWE